MRPALPNGGNIIQVFTNISTLLDTMWYIYHTVLVLYHRKSNVGYNTRNETFENRLDIFFGLCYLFYWPGRYLYYRRPCALILLYVECNYGVALSLTEYQFNTAISIASLYDFHLWRMYSIIILIMMKYCGCDASDQPVELIGNFSLQLVSSMRTMMVFQNLQCLVCIAALSSTVFVVLLPNDLHLSLTMLAVSAWHAYINHDYCMHFLGKSAFCMTEAEKQACRDRWKEWVNGKLFGLLIAVLFAALHMAWSVLSRSIIDWNASVTTAQSTDTFAQLVSQWFASSIFKYLFDEACRILMLYWATYIQPSICVLLAGPVVWFYVQQNKVNEVLSWVSGDMSAQTTLNASEKVYLITTQSINNIAALARWISSYNWKLGAPDCGDVLLFMVFLCQAYINNEYDTDKEFYDKYIERWPTFFLYHVVAMCILHLYRLDLDCNQ